MSYLAPYTNLMRIGQGFNSYTQQICIDDAVLIREIPENAEALGPPTVPGRFPHDTANATDSPVLRASTTTSSGVRTPQLSNVNQTVTYTCHVIDTIADVMNTLNISSSATIHYGSAQSGGRTNFVKESTISESDINFMVSVKVTNELPAYPLQMEFHLMEGLDPDSFPDVYGDCFIAGFLEGGEFSAIVSIKVQDKGKISRVKMAAELHLSTGQFYKPFESDNAARKENEDLWTDTDVSISVCWSGGGNIKKPEDSWDLATIIQAANDFPTQVSKFSQRTSAILMSYSALRSFHEVNAKLPKQLRVLNYRQCELYTAELLALFIAYRALWKHIGKILKSPGSYRPREDVPDFVGCDPASLNKVKQECRKAMTLVLQETTLLAKNPELGAVNDEGEMRTLPCPLAAEIEARLPVFVGPSKHLCPDSVSTAVTNVVNQYVTNPPHALPGIGSSSKLPRLGETFYSVDSTNCPNQNPSVAFDGAHHRNGDRTKDRSCGIYRLCRCCSTTGICRIFNIPRWFTRTDKIQFDARATQQGQRRVTGPGERAAAVTRAVPGPSNQSNNQTCQ